MENKQKETSDELTPEDREAFRFYLEVFLNNPRFDGMNVKSVLEFTEEIIKEEKRRFNVS